MVHAMLGVSIGHVHRRTVTSKSAKSKSDPLVVQEVRYDKGGTQPAND